MIKDLSVGDVVRGLVLYCKSKTSAVSQKTNNTYYSVTLQDASGVIDGKIWELTDSIDDFGSGDFVCIEGRVSSFNNSAQLHITSCRIVDPSMVRLDDFAPKTPCDVDELLSQLDELVDSVQNPYLKSLLESFFNDFNFMSVFREKSAAKTLHHAYRGGLLEHTVSVAENCEFIAKKYPKINRDLAITGALLHDIGKVKELSDFPENDYSDPGILLGHIFIGAEMVSEHAKAIDGFPENLRNELIHCILSHHGEIEHGAVKVPALIEAVAISYADDLDAKLRRFTDILADNNGEWSEKSDFALNTKFRGTML